MSHGDDPLLFLVTFHLVTRKKSIVVAMSHGNDPLLFLVTFLLATEKKSIVVASLNDDPKT